ncbi:MAG: carboxypeptidase regulatory-like domain-containing protein [Bryobacteraceae bacterium]
MVGRLTILFLFAAAPSLAGVISGKVVDDSGNAIKGAAVLIAGSTTGTFSDDSGEFRFENIAPGSYGIVVTLNGFESVRRANVVVRDDRPADLVVLLTKMFVAEEMAIASIAGAASNRAPYLTQSGIPPGSVFVGYGNNLGPANLTSAPAIPLQPMLDSFQVTVETNNRVYDCYPIYTSRTQFAAVMNSNVPPGDAMLRAGFNGRMSAPFRIRVPEFQPSVFQGADGRGILTRPDFSVITLEKPAKPGEVVIAWGTGWGAAPSDDRPVTFDKRPNLAGLELSLGGTVIPESQILYIGSGGFAGGDQIIFTLPDTIEPGCGVPFSARRRVTRADDAGASVGLTTFPVSRDGGPCGDGHGLGSEEVQWLTQGPLSLLTTRVTEALVIDGAMQSEGLLASFTGQSLDLHTYRGPEPFGTCGYAWTPANAAPPGRPLAFTGTASLAFPNLQIQFQPQSPFGPYTQALPASPVPGDGAYRISLSPDFTVDGARLSLSWGSNYERRSGRVIGQSRAAAANFVSRQANRIQELMDLLPSAVQSRTGVEYGVRVDGGSLGFHQMRCFASSEAAARAASRNSLASQEQSILHLFPPDSERRTLYLRVFDLDSNKTRRQGPVHLTNEVFDAEIDFDLSVQDYRRVLTAARTFNTNF